MVILRTATPLGARALLVLACLEAVSGMVPSFVNWGYCSDPELQINFDPLKYQGWWFDIERVPNEYQEAEQCYNTNVSWTGHTLESHLRGLTAEGEKTGKVASMTTDLNREPPNPAQMTLTSPGVPVVPYKVVATDYTHFSCVYSCLQLPGVYAEFFWIFGREPTMSEKFRHICYKKFEAAGIDTDKLQEARQDETCPYFAELEDKLSLNRRVYETYIRPTESNLELQTVAQIDAKEWQQDDSDSITYSVPKEHPLPEPKAVSKHVQELPITEKAEPSSAVAVLGSHLSIGLLVLLTFPGVLW